MKLSSLITEHDQHVNPFDEADNEDTNQQRFMYAYNTYKHYNQLFYDKLTRLEGSLKLHALKAGTETISADQLYNNAYDPSDHTIRIPLVFLDIAPTGRGVYDPQKYTVPTELKCEVYTFKDPEIDPTVYIKQCKQLALLWKHVQSMDLNAIHDTGVKAAEEYADANPDHNLNTGRLPPNVVHLYRTRAQAEHRRMNKEKKDALKSKVAASTEGSNVPNVIPEQQIPQNIRTGQTSYINYYWQKDAPKRAGNLTQYKFTQLLSKHLIGIQAALKTANFAPLDVFYSATGQGTSMPNFRYEYTMFSSFKGAPKALWVVTRSKPTPHNGQTNTSPTSTLYVGKAKIDVATFIRWSEKKQQEWLSQ